MAGFVKEIPLFLLQNIMDKESFSLAIPFFAAELSCCAILLAFLSNKYKDRRPKSPLPDNSNIGCDFTNDFSRLF